MWWESTSSSVIADSDLSNAVRCGLWCYLGRWFWVRLADVVLCLVGDLVKVSSLFCTFAFSVMTRMENDFSSNLVWHFCVFYTSWKWYGKKVGARWQLSVSRVICCYPPRTQEKVGGKQVKLFALYSTPKCSGADWEAAATCMSSWPSTSFQGLRFYHKKYRWAENVN